MSDIIPVSVVAVPLDRNPAAVYLARLSSGSRRTMLQSLNTIAGILTNGRDDALTCAWPQVRYQHSAAIRAALAERYAAATANKMLAALRGVLKECGRLELMSADDCARAMDVQVVKAVTLPRGRALSAGELRALFAACQDGTVAGARDLALCAVLYGCGLRRSEVVGLALSDYNVAEGSITVRRGKGAKDRIVYIANGAEALSAWLAVRGTVAGPLFWPGDRHGRLFNRQMSDQAVAGILRRRGKQAGLAHFSPHDLRRSNITDLLMAGVDVVTVQKMAGHSNVATTAIYDRRGADVQRKAAALLNIPKAA